MQDYKSISLAIFTDYDRVLKDLFATLYLDIHASIKTNLNVVDEGYIDDLKGYPEEHDLNNTIQRFFWAHYQCDLISSAKKNHHFKFPVSDVLQILTRKPFNKQKKLVIKIQKKFEQKHKLTSIDQFSYCAREIRRWRNLASHNNGLDSIAKASVLWSNLNILIKTYPDDLREKIRDLESLEKVVNEDFRNAVLENATVYQSIDAEKDIEKQIINYFKKHASTDNESDDTSQILEKLNLIELDTNNLLNEIVASKKSTDISIIALQKTIDSINDSLKSNLNYQRQKLNSQSPKTDNFQKEKISQKKITSSARTKSFEFKNVSFKPKLSANPKPKLRSSFEDHDSFVNNSNKENQKINKVIFDDSNRNKTSAEIRDDLSMLSIKIKDQMKLKFKYFQNWHNILMKPLIDQIILWEIKTIKDFREDEVFKKYYFLKKYPKSLTPKQISIERAITKKMMDYQIKNFWKDIKSKL